MAGSLLLQISGLQEKSQEITDLLEKFKSILQSDEMNYFFRNLHIGKELTEEQQTKVQEFTNKYHLLANRFSQGNPTRLALVDYQGSSCLKVEKELETELHSKKQVNAYFKQFSVTMAITEQQMDKANEKYDKKIQKFQSLIEEYTQKPGLLLTQADKDISKVTKWIDEAKSLRDKVEDLRIEINSEEQ